MPECTDLCPDVDRCFARWWAIFAPVCCWKVVPALLKSNGASTHTILLQPFPWFVPLPHCIPAVQNMMETSKAITFWGKHVLLEPAGLKVSITSCKILPLQPLSGRRLHQLKLSWEPLPKHPSALQSYCHATFLTLSGLTKWDFTVSLLLSLLDTLISLVLKCLWCLMCSPDPSAHPFY